MRVFMNMFCSGAANAALFRPKTPVPVPVPLARRQRQSLCKIRRRPPLLAWQTAVARQIQISACGSSSSGSGAAETKTELPEKLRKMVELFSATADARSKYEQLLHYGRALRPLAAEHHTAANKVRGCVSQVWIRAFLDEQGAVHFQADSDSALTKGLAALLVYGLSGSPPAQVAAISPDFVHALGLQQSLTPSRNNGFLNMFRLMQRHALSLLLHGHQAEAEDEDEAEAEAELESVSVSESAGRDFKVTGVDHGGDGDGRAARIRLRLQAELSPVALEIEDVSHQHAGHAGVQGRSGETHFNIKLVSERFQGLSLVKRHRLVYDLLSDEFNHGLHALSIQAKTPAQLKEP